MLYLHLLTLSMIYLPLDGRFKYPATNPALCQSYLQKTLDNYLWQAGYERWALTSSRCPSFPIFTFPWIRCLIMRDQNLWLVVCDYKLSATELQHLLTAPPDSIQTLNIDCNKYGNGPSCWCLRLNHTWYSDLKWL